MLVLVLLVGICIAESSEAQVKNVRFSGGSNAGEAPWAVGLLVSHNGVQSTPCMGTLVSDRHVVVSERCVDRVLLDTGASSLASVASITCGRDLLVPLHVASINDTVTHPTIDVAVLEIVPIPANFLDDGTIVPIHVAEPTTESDLFSSSSGTVYSWGTTSADGDQPRLLQEATLLLQTGSTCQARVSAEGIEYRQEWICVSDASASRMCLRDGGAPLVVLRDDGSAALVGVYLSHLDFFGEIRDCSVESSQISVFISMANVYEWLNGVASLRPAQVLGGSDEAPVFNGQQVGLQAASGSIVYSDVPAISTLQVEDEEEDDGDGADLQTLILHQGTFVTRPGCAADLTQCCCPSPMIEVALGGDGDELIVSSQFSCGLATGTAALEGGSVILTLGDKGNWTMSLSEGSFLQVVNADTLACSFSGLRVENTRTGPTE